MNKETRCFEFRTVDNEEEKMIIEGYAITFNSPATHYGMTEIIDSRALESCDMTDVPLKYNHDDSHLLLARTRNGSLKLEVDSIGLKIRAELIDTQSNKDIYTSIKEGLIDKMSFAFTTKNDSYIVYKIKEKKWLNLSMKFYSDELDKPFGVYSAVLEAFVGRLC